MISLDDWKRQLCQPASVLVPDVGAWDGRSLRSWFGRVTHGHPNEEWPASDGDPLWPLLQLVVDELPFVPARLEGVAMLQIFVPEDYALHSPNPLEVRAYPSLDGLVAAPDRGPATRLSSVLLKWELLECDLPEDLTMEGGLPDVPDAVQTSWIKEGLGPHVGTKVGGWPRFIQSGPYFADPGDPVQYEYVLQLGTHEELGWVWGDDGCCYLGRGVDPNGDRWESHWECF